MADMDTRAWGKNLHTAANKVGYGPKHPFFRHFTKGYHEARTEATKKKMNAVKAENTAMDTVLDAAPHGTREHAEQSGRAQGYWDHAVAAEEAEAAEDQAAQPIPPVPRQAKGITMAVVGTRNWEKWHEEHPYEDHPKPKHDDEHEKVKQAIREGRLSGEWQYGGHEYKLTSHVGNHVHVTNVRPSASGKHSYVHSVGTKLSKPAPMNPRVSGMVHWGSPSESGFKEGLVNAMQEAERVHLKHVSADHGNRSYAVVEGTRDWHKWHLEHPYVAHGIAKADKHHYERGFDEAVSEAKRHKYAVDEAHGMAASAHTMHLAGPVHDTAMHAYYQGRREGFSAYAEHRAAKDQAKHAPAGMAYSKGASHAAGSSHAKVGVGQSSKDDRYSWGTRSNPDDPAERSADTAGYGTDGGIHPDHPYRQNFLRGYRNAHTDIANGATTSDLASKLGGYRPSDLATHDTLAYARLASLTPKQAERHGYATAVFQHVAANTSSAKIK
jgi:hypothetical protein